MHHLTRMNFSEFHNAAAVLQELGRRLERHRLARNLTQETLAREAGVGRATVQRMEQGDPVKSTQLIKVLRELGLLDALDASIPETVRSPLADLERDRRRGRRRASRSGTAPSPDQPWTWGDEGSST
jgi:transcriptional regulator with XRE-family HTH domain